MTLSRRTALNVIAALPAAVVIPAAAVACAPAIEIAATSASPDADIRALVDQFADAQKRCNDAYHRADMLSGLGEKKDPKPKALFWRKSDGELGLTKPYYVGIPDEAKTFGPADVDTLRQETWLFTSVETDEDRLTTNQCKRAPSPEARARADEIIAAFDQWYKEPKPRRGYKKAMRDARRVDNEIDDLVSQICDVKCRTMGGLGEKIRALMACHGANVIEDIGIGKGEITEEIALSIFRDLSAMAGKAAEWGVGHAQAS